MKTGSKIVIVVIVVGLIVFGALTALKKAKERESKTPVAKLYPVVVNTFMPKESHVRLTLPALTEVHNDKNVVLSPLISARVLNVMLSGQRVKKGEVVARLDTTQIQSRISATLHNLDAVKISLQNLLATHKRTKELLEVKGTSIEQYDKESTQLAQIRSQIETLHATLDALHNNLDYAIVRSPVNGVISKVFINRGGIAIAGHPIISISADRGYYLLLRVPTDLAINGVLFRSKQYRALPLFRSFNGLGEYKIYVDQKGLIDGERVPANVIIYNAKGVFLPFETLLNINDKNYVLVVDGAHATQKRVHVIADGQQGVIVSSLAAGTKIVQAKPDVLLKLTSGFALQVRK